MLKGQDHVTPNEYENIFQKLADSSGLVIGTRHFDPSFALVLPQFCPNFTPMKRCYDVHNVTSKRKQSVYKCLHCIYEIISFIDCRHHLHVDSSPKRKFTVVDGILVLIKGPDWFSVC